jgi:hypothetical protein
MNRKRIAVWVVILGEIFFLAHVIGAGITSP